MTKKEYIKNVDLLNSWAKAYYTLDNPIASDEEYDKLYKEILKYEAKNKDDILPYSPSLRVGAEILDEFKKSSHLAKMWSMEDIFSFDELKAWIKRGNKQGQEFYIEPKFDGASLNLLYVDGILQKASTRGDGEIGEDVTNNALVISSIPLKIPYKEQIEIRGEVIIRKSDFELINQKRAKENLAPLSNPRNAASGSLRQLDPKITASRKLLFIPWGIGQNSLNFTSHFEVMNFIRELGFLKDDFIRLAKSADEIELAYKELNCLRNDKDFLMDGMVVRVNSLSFCEELGFTVKFPKFMLAYKFQAVQKVSKILDINLQVGRSGIITPVAVLQSINIDGVNVKSASLHNFEEIKRLDIKLNDYVLVVRSGDVIPKITGVFKDRRQSDAKEIIKPKFCPICKSHLLIEDILIKCQNLNCSARVKSSLIYYASKKCMNIDGLGKAIIELLYDKKKISKISDIYRLKFEDFVELEGFKEKKINNILASIEKSKEVNLHSFITSLGIEHIGEVAAKKIALFGKDWLNLSEEELNQIDGFGQIMIRSYLDFIDLNKDFINELASFLKINYPLKQEIKQNIFTNKIVVLTGTFFKNKDELKKELESFGAKVTSSVSKKSDFVIYGLNAGSKLDKAKELNIKILSQDEYKEMI